MTDRRHHSKAHRIITAAVGALLAGAAVAIVLVADRGIGPWLASTVLGVLGIDAMASAFRDKPSLLSRIGPLP